MNHQTFTFLYQLRKDHYTLDGTSYIGYGIDIIHTADQSIYRTAKDISVCEQDVAALVERCNRLQLDPEHLDDVLEDHLAYAEC